MLAYRSARWGEFFRLSRRSLGVMAAAGLAYAAACLAYLAAILPSGGATLELWGPWLDASLKVVFALSVAAVALGERRAWIFGAALVAVEGPALGLLFLRLGELLWLPGVHYGCVYDVCLLPIRGWSAASALVYLVLDQAVPALAAVALAATLRLGRWAARRAAARWGRRADVPAPAA